ncbi:hypothetical protein [Absicoccus sp.]|nr:hypothetical protein [Absicoccus sp.]
MNLEPVEPVKCFFGTGEISHWFQLKSDKIGILELLEPVEPVILIT